MKLHPGPILAFLTVLLLLPPSARAGTGSASDPLIIGMAETMLVDVPAAKRTLLNDRIAALMKEFTGLHGKLQFGGSAEELASQLESKKVQLGVLQGVELAWLQKKHPSLKPLMVASSDAMEKRHLFALLLVRKDNAAKSLAELKGKNVAYPLKNKEHMRLFVERRTGGDPKGFFKAFDHTMSTEDSLDALVKGKVDAVVADMTAVNFYRRIKPGAFAKLAVAEKSEPFPAGVLVYSEGGVGKKALDQVRQGMLKANTSERGQDLMADWNIVSFDPVFAEYQADLEAIRKAYPGK